MYQITAVFNKSILGDVLEDLEAIGIYGVTIVDVIDKNTIMKGVTSMAEAKIKLDIVVSSEYYKELTMTAIRDNTMGLSCGSGKIWITPVMDVERMSTGEKGTEALKYKTEEKSDTKLLETFYELDTPAT